MQPASTTCISRGLIFMAAWFVMHLVITPAPVQAQLSLPPIPQNANFVQDDAEVLPHEAEREIGRLQRIAFEQHDTPIIVVTIGSMAEYGGSDYSIERFAHEWFNHWEIGKRGDSGELINQGILLLISTGDRKARIELGADWGRRWDSHAARIMSDAIVPKFKQGDYGAGTRAGTAALMEMAEMGPDAEPPQGMGNLVESLNDKPLATTPLPLWGIGLMAGAGVVLLVLAIFLPEYRKWLLIVGIGLIVGALVLWVVLAILGLVLRGRSGGGGGFSSGGGFSTGGFSGGGGASGSW